MSESISLPLLPLRNAVLLPNVLAPLSVQRAASIAAVEAALSSEDKLLAVVAQRDVEVADPTREQLYSIGCKAVIKRMARAESGLQLILLGVERLELLELEQTFPFLKGRFQSRPVQIDTGPEAEALSREIAGQGSRIQENVEPEMWIDVEQFFEHADDPMAPVYVLAAMAGLSFEKAQRLLDVDSSLQAMKLLHEDLTHELQVLQLQKHIATQASQEIGKEQREYVLRQQLRAIQEELGETAPEEAEVAQLRRRFAEADLPEVVRRDADRELARLEKIPAAAPDFQVTRTHLELILELPWTHLTSDNLDLTQARQVLDADHYGLKEIKERIVEHLAVMKLNPGAHAPILCFVGPPGVGKTSLGQSIARALGRKFERMSLGGMHDEAELRGHRRTYIGAMPGRIIQAIRRAGVRNPLLMLDEVDKLGQDYRGDPASALLEILDPAQNKEFRDNYLDLPFDLSKVFFITTANATDTIPRPLLDRMESIRLSGYTEEEKLEIARRYLLPRQRREAGLSEEQLVISDDVLHRVIGGYTRESGVRELERMLGSLARKAAMRIADGASQSLHIAVGDVEVLLGPERFFLEQARENLPAGVATGLAWTSSGGDVLFVEALALPGQDGRFVLTGQLGEVMKESALAAQSYVIAYSARLGIDPPKAGVHIHVPAGAIPKDGPSAGVTMAVCLASLYTNYKARSDTAMTGEITLSGLVLPVGGIKEKTLAARRAGLKRVILPKANAKDLRELPDEVRNELEFVLASRIEDVLADAIPELAARLT